MELVVDSGRGLAVLRLSGVLSLELLERASDALMAHPEFGPTLHTLWDLRGVDAHGISTQDLQSYSGSQVNWTGRKDRRVAVVVSEDLVFGLARIWTALAEERIPANRRVFRSYDEARSWLRGG